MAPPPLGQLATAASVVPARPVTEDTPPDLLTGTMDLTVVLPHGQTVRMSVHRSTPMMDLLIHVTTCHKINPGGHVIQLVSDNRLLSYKPSTPIGTLDTSIIQIVAKNKLNEAQRNRSSHLSSKLMEKNLRLTVNLPRNQLAVYRVPPKTLLSDVLSMVCSDKGLDPETHEIRHPVNVDEKLRPTCTLAHYQLQEVTLVSKDFRAPPLSVTDLITMASIAHPEDKKRRGILSLFSRKTKSSLGESSVSSDSAGERSVSPARSDENNGTHTPRPSSPDSSSTLTLTTTTLQHHNSQTHLSRPPSSLNLARPRKRQAPAPPSQPHNKESSGAITNDKSQSRRSCVSSGDYQEDEENSPTCSSVGTEVSSGTNIRPPTNLITTNSSSSLSIASKGKRKAPVPPRASTVNSSSIAQDPLPPPIPEEVEVQGNQKNHTKDLQSDTNHIPRSSSPIDTSSASSSLSKVDDGLQIAQTELEVQVDVDKELSVSSTSPDPEDIPMPPLQEAPQPPPPSVAAACSSSSSLLTQSATDSISPTNEHPVSTTPDACQSLPVDVCTDAAGTNLGNAAPAAASSRDALLDADQQNSAENKSEHPDGLCSPNNNSNSTLTEQLAHGEMKEICNDSKNSTLVSSHRLKENAVVSATTSAPRQHSTTSSQVTHFHPTSSAVSQISHVDTGADTSNTSENITKADVSAPPSLNKLSESKSDVESEPVTNHKPVEIPTFRIVTKNRTEVNNNFEDEDSTSRQFVVDGKSQQVSEKEKFGTMGSGSKRHRPYNPLLAQPFDDDNDLDISEELFEPLKSSSSSNLSVKEKSPVENQTTSDTSTSKPQPRPRKKFRAPCIPQQDLNLSQDSKSVSSSPSPPKDLSGGKSGSSQRLQRWNAEIDITAALDDISSTKEIISVQDDIISVSDEQLPSNGPIVQSVAQELPSSASETPVNAPETGRDIIQESDVAASPTPSKEGISLADIPSSNISSNDESLLHKSHETGESVLPTATETCPHEEVEKVLGEEDNEEFKVHTAKVDYVDPDKLSLLSETCVDDEMSSLNSGNESDCSSKLSESSHTAAESSPLQPPLAEVSSARSYLDGYFKMIAELHLSEEEKEEKKGEDKEEEEEEEEEEVASAEKAKSLSDSDCSSSQSLPKISAPIPAHNIPDQNTNIPASLSSDQQRGMGSPSRQLSSSSLCSDTDHEVQTRTVSLSSESSQIENGEQPDQILASEHWNHNNDLDHVNEPELVDNTNNNSCANSVVLDHGETQIYDTQPGITCGTQTTEFIDIQEDYHTTASPEFVESSVHQEVLEDVTCRSVSTCTEEDTQQCVEEEHMEELRNSPRISYEPQELSNGIGGSDDVHQCPSEIDSGYVPSSSDLALENTAEYNINNNEVPVTFKEAWTADNEYGSKEAETISEAINETCFDIPNKREYQLDSQWNSTNENVSSSDTLHEPVEDASVGYSKTIHVIDENENNNQLQEVNKSSSHHIHSQTEIAEVTEVPLVLETNVPEAEVSSSNYHEIIPIALYDDKKKRYWTEDVLVLPKKGEKSVEEVLEVPPPPLRSCATQCSDNITTPYNQIQQHLIESQIQEAFAEIEQEVCGPQAVMSETIQTSAQPQLATSQQSTELERNNSPLPKETPPEAHPSSVPLVQPVPFAEEQPVPAIHVQEHVTQVVPLPRPPLRSHKKKNMSSSSITTTHTISPHSSVVPLEDQTPTLSVHVKKGDGQSCEVVMSENCVERGTQKNEIDMKPVEETKGVRNFKEPRVSRANNEDYIVAERSIAQVNNFEPRIIELKHKVIEKEVGSVNSAGGAVLATRKISDSLITKESEYTKRQDANKSSRLQVEHRNKWDSVSSYESCTPGVTSEDIPGSNRGSRSNSVSSYESAPPPLPEYGPPLEYVPGKSRKVTSRQNSISSESGSDSSRPSKPLLFSISTYASRSEETSYEKKITKSESFSHLSRPRSDSLPTGITKAESFSSSTNKKRKEKRLGDSESDDSSKEKNSEEMFRKPAPVSANREERKVDIAAALPARQLPLTRSTSSLQSSAYPVLPVEPFVSSRRTQELEDTRKYVIGRTSSMHNLNTSSQILRKSQSSVDVSGGGEKESFIKFHGDSLACPEDSQLAQEYAKLQHRFVHWQEQLVHNQQVLHQRVAPLAGTKPLHSVGVLREILSQSSEFNRSDNSHDSNSAEQENIGKYGQSSSPNHLQELPQSSCTTLPPCQTVCVGDEEPNTEAVVSSSLDHRRSQQFKANDIPTVPVGGWAEKPEPVQYKKVSRTISAIPQKSVDEGTSRVYPTLAQPFSKPVTAKKPQFFKSRKDIKQFGSTEAINPRVRTESESAAFWKELQARRIDLGLQNEEAEEPVNTHSSEAFYPRNKINIAQESNTTIGHSQDPSRTVCYGNDQQADRNVADISDTSAQRNPRYTSVVTLAAQNEGSSESVNGAASKNRDKVRSVVQLGNSQAPPSVQQQQKTTKGIVPVVRGFRQTDSDQGTGQTFHSRIIANALSRGSSGATPASSSIGSFGKKNPVNSTSSTFIPSNFNVKNNTNSTTKGSATVPVTSAFSARNSSPPAIGNSSTSGKHSSSLSGSDLLMKSNSSPDSVVNSHPLRDYRSSLTSKVTTPPSASYEVPSFNQGVPISSVQSNSYQDNSVATHDDTPNMFPSHGKSKLTISNNSVPPPPPPPPLLASADISAGNANNSGPSGQLNSGERRTASGKRIVAPKIAPKLDPREELMLAIRQFGGSTKLRATKT
ncbi:uncharacterized protein LOC143024696 isoform X2 [Oratosquilla oratoria]